MFSDSKEIDKNLDKLFGKNDGNYELKEIFRQLFTNKIDENKLKELKEKREREIAYIMDRFELTEPVITEGSVA